MVKVVEAVLADLYNIPGVPNNEDVLVEYNLTLTEPAEMYIPSFSMYVTSAEHINIMMANWQRFVAGDLARNVIKYLGWNSLMAPVVDEDWGHARKEYEEFLSKDKNHKHAAQTMEDSVVNAIAALKKGPTKVYDVMLKHMFGGMLKIFYADNFVEPEEYIENVGKLLMVINDAIDGFRFQEAAQLAGDPIPEDTPKQVMYKEYLNKLIAAGVNSYTTMMTTGKYVGTFWETMHNVHTARVLRHLAKQGITVLEDSSSEFVYEESGPTLREVLAGADKEISQQRYNRLVAEAVAAEVWGMVVAQSETLPALMTTFITLLGMSQALQNHVRNLLTQAIAASDRKQTIAITQTLSTVVHLLYSPIPLSNRDLVIEPGESYEFAGKTFTANKNLSAHFFAAGRRELGVAGAGIDLDYVDIFDRILAGEFGKAADLINTQYAAGYMEVDGKAVRNPKKCLGLTLAVETLRQFILRLVDYKVPEIAVDKAYIKAAVVLYLETAEGVQLEDVS